MTPDQKTHVETSWPKLCESAATFVDSFYQRMFEFDPHLKHLFADLDKQAHALANMIGGALVSLRHEEDFVDMHQALGRRHAAYRVPVESFDAFREAFAWAVATALEVPLDDPVPAAWAALFDTARAPFLAGLRAERRRLKRQPPKT